MLSNSNPELNIIKSSFIFTQEIPLTNSTKNKSLANQLNNDTQQLPTSCYFDATTKLLTCKTLIVVTFDKP